MTLKELTGRMYEKGGIFFVLKNNEIITRSNILITTGDVDLTVEAIIEGLQLNGIENIAKYLSTGGSLGFLECGQREIASTMVVEEGECVVVFVLKNAIMSASEIDMIISLIKDRNKDPRLVKKDYVVYTKETYANNIVTASGCADNITVSWGYIRINEPQVTKLDLSELESAITEKAKADMYPITVGEISENSELPINMITDAKIIGAELGELLNCHPEYQQKLINIIAKTIKL